MRKLLMFISMKMQNRWKKIFYEHMEQKIVTVGKHDVKVVMTDSNAQMLEDLISLGTNLEDCWWDPEHKTTLLHIAAKNSFKMVKHVLCMQKNPDEWNNDGQTALHCAALSGRALTVKYLLDEGHIPIDQRDRNGKTSLMLLSSMGDWGSWTPRMMEFLIHEGADVKLCDNENRTALELALQSRVYCAAEILDLEEWVQT
ncbi:ankycorbin-like [Schistocerca gregaria]|uniref:ankycorbin-like n=1 Tax=Schistocerca gregaria TaxID=7010 RepID=UPI00211F2451|nr:ankycorbin-like [Schistocerca gregaria]